MRQHLDTSTRVGQAGLDHGADHKRVFAMAIAGTRSCVTTEATVLMTPLGALR